MQESKTVLNVLEILRQFSFAIPVNYHPEYFITSPDHLQQWQ